MKTRTRARRMAAVAAVTLIVAACSSGSVPAEMSSLVGSPAASPSSTESSAVATESPSGVPSPSPSASPSSSVAPAWTPAPPTREPSLGPLPKGDWTGLKWTQGPTILECDGESIDACETASLFAWSKGYLLFRSAGGESLSIKPSVSAEGRSWRPGHNMDTRGIEGVGIVQLEEGPKGLLAIGRSGAMGLCGHNPIWIQGLWISPDGLAWTRIDLRAAFGGGVVYEVSAGPAGYIADGIAADGVSTAAWISTDGRTWTTATLPEPAATAATVDNAVSFGGGYVIAVDDFEGCGSIELLTASVWHSEDGANWTVSDLPGHSADLQVGTSIYRSGSQGLLAIRSTSSDRGKTLKQTYWTSADGLAWSQVTGPALTGERRSVVGYGGSTLVVSWSHPIGPDDEPDEDGTWPVYPPEILVFDGTAKLTALKQSGEAPELMPSADGGGFGYLPLPNWAFGRSGLLVLVGGTLWVGLPTTS